MSKASARPKALPAAGTAELIVDITTTGNTLAANALKIIDDGTMLRSQANLVASRKADWSNGTLDTARMILDRIAGQDRARSFREMRTRFKGCDDALAGTGAQRFGIVTPFGGPTSSGMLTLHCPPNQVLRAGDFLRDKGAQAISVSEIDYVFTQDNPLFEKLKAGL